MSTEADLRGGRRRSRPASWNMLVHFGEMKKALGETEYYRILGANGYEKSTEIEDINKARAVYKMMAERKKEIDDERERAAI